MNIKSYLSKKHDIIEISNKEITMDCPDCGKGGSHFQISTVKDTCHCFKCGYKNDWAGLIGKLEGIEHKDARAIVSRFDNNVFFNPFWDVIVKEVEKEEEEEFSEVILPPNIGWTNRANTFIKKRGVTKQIVDQFKLYFCGRGYYSNRIIIPIIHNDKCVGFQGRTILNESFDSEGKKIKKYLWAEGNPASKLLYNSAQIQSGSSVVIVEGVFDVFSLWQQGISNVVATFGKNISAKQLEILTELAPCEVILWYDPDALREMEKIYKKLIKQFRVKLAYYPEGDPGDCLIAKEVLANQCFNLSDFNNRMLEDGINDF